jgi:hypothetical protein
MRRPRLLTLVVLGMAVSVVSTLCEATSRRIHMTAQVAQERFIGDPASPQLGDRSIINVDLFDESGASVGTGGASCIFVSVPPLDTRVQCLLTAVLAEGQIMFGGVAPLAAVGASAQFGILGGTGDFRNARGEASTVRQGPIPPTAAPSESAGRTAYTPDPCLRISKLIPSRSTTRRRPQDG